jgi:hypothetical protein
MFQTGTAEILQYCTVQYEYAAMIEGEVCVLQLQ